MIENSNAEASSHDAASADCDSDEQLLDHLRFLTPREVANLKGFPPQQAESQSQAKQYSIGATAARHDGDEEAEACDATTHGFSLPQDIGNRQAYALLGNSLR